MARPHDLVSRTAQRALEEFSAEFDAAYAVADAEPWAERLGFTYTSGAIRTTYPIPVSSAGYKLVKGDDHLRRLMSASLSVTPVEYYDGVEELAAVIEAPDFIGWGDEPAKIAMETRRQPNILVAALLEANANIDLYRYDLEGGSAASSRALFAADHPFNIFDTSVGTFDNDIAVSGGTINETVIKASKERFRAILGPNGRPMGLRMTHLIVPPEREEEARDFFERDTLVQAVTNVAGTENVGGVALRNRHAGTVELIVADELTDADVIYPVASLPNGRRPWPWVYQNNGAPEELRQDKTSSYFFETRKVAVKYYLTQIAAAAMPHAIEKIDLS